MRFLLQLPFDTSVSIEFWFVELLLLPLEASESQAKTVAASQ